MNKSYKSVWNESTGTYAAASEVTKGRGKSSVSKKALVIAMLMAGAGASLDAEAAGTGTQIGACAKTDAGQPQNATFSIAINGTNPGNCADATGNIATAIGANTMASGVGTGVSLGGLNASNIAVNYSLGYGQLTLGGGSSATATGATAVGYNSGASGIAAVAIGQQSFASGNSSFAAGENATASGVGAIALGALTSASGTGAVALGANSVANRANTVSVGSATATRQIVNVAQGTQATDAVNLGQLQQIGIKTDSSGNITNGFVAYDDSTKGRLTLGGASGTTLTGVKAGAVSAVSTDAVNGSQLYANAASTAAALGGGATVKADGTVSTPSYTVGGATANSVGAAISNIDTRVSQSTTDIGTLNTQISAINGQMADAVKYDTSAHDKVTLGGASGATLTGVKAGAVSASSTDAVNGSQLYATNQNVTKNANDISTLNTAITNINSGSAGLVQQDATSRAITVASTTAGTTVDFTGTAGARQLKGVAAGTVSSSSMDAVNGSQLYATNQTVAQNSNDIAQNAKDIAKNAGDLSTLNTTVTNINNGSVGLVQQDAISHAITVAGTTAGTTVDFTGMAGARQLKGVAAGVANTDAVNMSQLKDVDTRAQDGINGLNVDMASVKDGVNGLNGEMVSVKDGINGLNGDMASVKDGVNGLNGEMASVKDGINGLNGDMVSVKDGINGLNGDVASVKDGINGLNGEMASVKDGIDGINGSITSITNQITSGELGLVQQDATTRNLTVAANTDGAAVDFTGTAGPRQLKGVSAGTADTDAVNVAQLKDVDTRAQDGINGLNGEMVSVKDGINGLNGDMASVKDGVNGLNGEMASVKDGINGLNGDMVSVKDGINGLNGDMVSVKDGINGLNGDMASVKDGINGLNGDMVSVKDGINGLNGDVASVKDGINGLNGEMASVKDGIDGINGSITSITNQITSGELGLVQQDATTRNLTVAANTDGAAVDFTGTAGARQLKGVSAGTADTDAVNVAQLKDVDTRAQDGINGLNGEMVSVKDGINGLNGDMASVKDGVNGLNGEMASVKDGIDGINGSITSITNQITSGELGLVQQDATTRNLTVAANTDGAAVDFTGTAGPRQLKGVSAGTADTDAVNVAQLKDVDTRAQDGINGLNGEMVSVKDGINGLNGDMASVKDGVNGLNGEMASVKDGINGLNGDMVSVKDGINGLNGDMVSVKDGINGLNGDMASVKDGVNGLNGEMASVKDGIDGINGSITSITNQINSGELGLVQQDQTSRDLTVGATTDGLQISMAGMAGNRVVTGVAAGALSATSSDAVNGSQLFATNNNVAQNTAAIAQNTGDIAKSAGDIAQNTSDIAQNSSDIAKNAGDITNIDSRVTNVEGSVSSITNQINSGELGLVQQDQTTRNLTVGATTDGLQISMAGTAGNRVVTGVAAGTLSATSSDAVNGSQLFATNDNVAQNTAAIAQNTGDIAKNASDIAQNSTDIAKSAGDIAQNTSDIAKNAGDIAQNTSDIAKNAGDITNIDSRVTNVEGSVSNITNQINNGELGLVQQDQTTRNLTVGAATDGLQISMAGTAGNRVVTGVAAGALSATSSDAVNGSQLFATNDNVAQNTAAIAQNTGDIAQNSSDIAKNAGDIAQNASDIAKNSGDIAQNSSDIAKNAGDITNIDSRVTNVEGSVSSITNQINNGELGLVQQDQTTRDLTVGATTDGLRISMAGAAGNRVVTGVAAGALSATSSDAVNGSQLFATNDNVAQNTAAISKNTGDIAQNSSDIAKSAGDIAQNSSDIAKNTGDIAQNSSDIAKNAGDIAQNTSDIAKNAGDITNIDSRVTNVEGSVSNITNQINNGELGLVQQDQTTRDLMVASDKDGARVNFAGTAGARELVGVAAGTTSNSAVNVGQLSPVVASLGGGAQVNADGSVTGPTYHVQGGTQNTVGGALDSLDNGLSSLQTQINNGSIGMVTQNQTSRDILVGAATDGLRVNMAGTAGNRVVTGVAAGAIGAQSSDAVNGSQLHATAASTASALGGGSTVNEDGTVSAPTYSVGGTTVNNVGAAITNIDGRVTQNTSDIASLQTTVGTMSGSVANAVSYDSAAHNQVTLGGSASAPKVKLTNLQDGELSATSSDAVTGAQLWNTNQQVANLNQAVQNQQSNGNSGIALDAGGPAASATGTDSIAIGGGAQATGDNSVALGAGSVADQANTVSVGSPGNERRITNVADGQGPTDAVNMRQFQQGIGSVARNAYSGVAAATALTMIPDVDQGKTIAVGIGAGNYKGYQAVSLGMSARITQNLKIKAGAGISSADTTYGVGAAYQW